MRGRRQIVLNLAAAMDDYELLNIGLGRRQLIRVDDVELQAHKN